MNITAWTSDGKALDLDIVQLEFWTDEGFSLFAIRQELSDPEHVFIYSSQKLVFEIVAGMIKLGVNWANRSLRKFRAKEAA